MLTDSKTLQRACYEEPIAHFTQPAMGAVAQRYSPRSTQRQRVWPRIRAAGNASIGSAKQDHFWLARGPQQRRHRRAAVRLQLGSRRHAQSGGLDRQRRRRRALLQEAARNERHQPLTPHPEEPPKVASRGGRQKGSSASCQSIVRKSVRGLARKRCSTFMNLEHLVRFQVILPESGML